ncbi:MAG: hypothetical protein RSC73_07420, partial [Ruthenibacterium sp.]
MTSFWAKNDEKPQHLGLNQNISPNIENFSKKGLYLLVIYGNIWKVKGISLRTTSSRTNQMAHTAE